MNEEIFYLIAYQKDTGKWRSADEMLGHFISRATDGDGPVHFINEDNEPEWRNLHEGEEKDIDFENAQILGGFLRELNEDASP